MLELGGNIYFTAKLGATDGHSFRHLAAVMTGSTQDDYAAMMLARRPLGRRQPRRSRASTTSRPRKPKAKPQRSAKVQILSKKRK